MKTCFSVHCSLHNSTTPTDRPTATSLSSSVPPSPARSPNVKLSIPLWLCYKVGTTSGALHWNGMIWGEAKQICGNQGRLSPLKPITQIPPPKEISIPLFSLFPLALLPSFHFLSISSPFCSSSPIPLLKSPYKLHSISLFSLSFPFHSLSIHRPFCLFPISLPKSS